MKFTVVLHEEEGGGYSVTCVELPAAISQGDTREEALRNIREAVELVLEVRHEQGAALGEIVQIEIAHV